MESVRLKQFCSVVDSNSLTKASIACGISLSGLSKSMKNLQQEIGFELFVQNGRGIMITPRGYEVYAEFRKAIQILENIKKTPTQTNEVRIGCLEVFSYNLIGDILVQDNQTVFQIQELAPGNLENQIYQRKIDYGYTYLPISHQEVAHEPIGKIRLGAFAKEEKFRKLNLSDIPFVVPATGMGHHPASTKERDGWPLDLPERKVFAQVNLLSTAIDLVLSGHCAIFMPKFICDRLNSRLQSALRIVELDINLSARALIREVYFAKTEGSPEVKSIKKFNQNFKKLITS